MSNKVNTRELILDILLSIMRDGEYSHIAIGDVLDKYRWLPKQDRAFIKRVSEGTLEHMIELDYIIDQFSKTKVKKMKPAIRCILRMGVYQLKYMNSVPDRAACSEAVKLAERKGFFGLKGFVNGVMRNISRGLDQIVMPDREKDIRQYLSVCYSLPLWLTDMWMDAYGADKTEQMAQAFMEPAPTTIRTNLRLTTPDKLRQKLEEEGVIVKPYKDRTDAFQISEYDTLDALESFEQGLFYVQDAATMTAVQNVDLKKDAYVIDVCAAPGGKSIQAAEMLQGTGMVEARDLTEYKVTLIEDNMERCQVKNMRARCQDASVKDPESEGKADLVIADLPCSGLGVLGRKPDIRYRVTKEDIHSLSALQRKILDTVYTYVKPGGQLLYSTCTVNPEENDSNTAWFVQTHPQFRLESEQQIFPEKGVCDGFYTAVFRKEV